MSIFIYARWSSLEQTKGSTLERQMSNCRAFADQQGWTVEDAIIDRGMSAYTGSNITDGNLGKFADRVKAGAVGTSPVLIVEELDRLSRQPADVMLSWLSPLVRAGLTIHVTQTGQRIDQHMLDFDMGGLMMLLITAFGSNTESRKKAERVASAWQKKRDDAREGKAVQTNHRHPAWLRSVEGGFELIADRAKIVKLIFANRANGVGKGLTAKQLNASGVPTFTNAKMWTATYVGRVLANRAVVGEWQPFSGKRSDKHRKAIGEPITGFYPRVVDDATFAAANADKIKHQLKHQGRGKAVSNLLGPKARCAKCGGVMSALGSGRYRVKKDGTKSRYYFLYCSNAKVAKTCDHHMGWVYDRIETPLLDTMLTLAMDDAHFANEANDVTSFETAVLAARGKVDALTLRVQRLLDMIEDDDDHAMERYRERRNELADARQTLEDAEAALAEARGAVTPEAHLKRVHEVRELLSSDDEDLRYQARQKVKAAIQDVLAEMTFDPDLKSVKVSMLGGLGALIIHHGGSYQRYDLFKEGRNHESGNYTHEEREAIRGIIRRREAA